MAGIQPVSFTSPGYDYGADQTEILRRQKMAELLQQRALESGSGTEYAPGGWAVRKSPLEGLSKVAQGYMSGKSEQDAQELARTLAEKFQRDYRETVSTGLRQMRGTPASYEDAAGNYAPQGAQGADPEAALATFMSHPMAAQLASLPMQQIQRQQLVAALRGQQGGGQPMTPQPGAGAPTGAPMQPGHAPMQGQQPAAAQQTGVGGPAGGVPMEAWIQADPTGKAYMEQLAKDHMAFNMPQNVRPQGTIAVPDGKGGYRQAYYSAPVGEGMTRTPEGAASVVPGYLEGQSALGKTPLEKVVNADQTVSYIPRAQLSGAANASPIPQAQPAPAAALPRPVFPRESPQERSGRMEGRLGILQNELGAEQAKLADPRTPQEDRVNAQQNIAAIQREIAGTPGGAKPVAGPPRFGQTQKEQIEQAAETAAAETEAKERAKLRVDMPEARLRLQTQNQDLERLATAANEIANRNLARASGPMGGVPSFPGGNAAQVESLITSLKAQVSGMKLQAMRDASKTGGAIGQVTEKEWPRLENMVVALDPVRMGPKMFREKLFELVAQIQQVKTQLQNAFDTQYRASAPGTTGGLNDAEQTELQQLRARFGRR